MRWDRHVLLSCVISISLIFEMAPVDCLASAIFSAACNPSSNGFNFCLSNKSQNSKRIKHIKRYSKNLFQDLHSDLTRVWNPFCNPASQVTRFPVEFCALSWPDRKAELKLYTVAWLRTSLLPWSLKKTSKGRQGEPTKTQLVQKFQEVWFCWRMLIIGHTWHTLM